MKITVAKHAGFCFGVKNAVEIAKSRAPKTVYTLGKLIHNERVVNELSRLGAKPAIDFSLLKKGDTAVIRAHGIAPAQEAELAEKGVELLDATCPFVKKVQNIVSDYSRRGYSVIIAGEMEHAEVRALLGYAAGKVYVIKSTDEIDMSVSDKFCVVSQTTFSQEKYSNIVSYIQNCIKDSGKTVEFFNTICYTTKARQSEAYILSKENEVVFVLGSKSSSNANRLFEIAKQCNDDVYFIESVADIPRLDYTVINTMAVLAAASTPQESIEEVLYYMSETQSKILDNSTVEAVEAAPAVVAEDAIAVNVAKEEVTDTAAAVEEVAAPDAEKEHKELTMEDIISSDKKANFTEYKEGKRIKAKIIQVDESGLFVNIGGKKDGFIDKTEVNIDGSYNPSEFAPEQIVDAVIISKKSKDGDYISLSKREVDLKKAQDEEARKAFASNEFTLEPPLKIVKNKEGNPVGLEGRLGAFSVFIPGSQIRMGRVNNLEDYLNKKLRLRVLQENGRRITASQRVILEEEHAKREDSFWDSMVPGAVVNGKVKRFAAFGAFVNVKGIDCLAHISDLSWNKITDAGKVLEIDKSYDFVVLKADRDTRKVSLGFKQLQKKPYEVAAEKYPVGTVIKGTVARLHPFGAFVQIEEGVDGLIHVSQISHKWIKDANEALKVGDEVEAKIIGFEDNRITLSIKELLPPPEEEAAPVQKEERKERTESVESYADEKPVANKPRAPRARKFEYDANKSDDRRRDRRDNHNDGEPREWVSDSGVASLADLLKDIKFNFSDEDGADEPAEKPAKKTKAKKAAADDNSDK